MNSDKFSSNSDRIVDRILSRKVRMVRSLGDRTFQLRYQFDQTMRGVDRQVQDVRKRAKLESLKDIYEEDENLVNDDNHYHAVINEIDKEAHAERDVVGEQADIAADEAAEG